MAPRRLPAWRALAPAAPGIFDMAANTASRPSAAPIDPFSIALNSWPVVRPSSFATSSRRMPMPSVT